MDEEPLDRRLGSAAAHAALNVRIASPAETANSVLRRMQGMRFDSAGVVAVCSGQRLVGLVTIERFARGTGAGHTRHSDGRSAAGGSTRG